MKISVTQAHINEGVPKVGAQCPIALAIKEATGANAYVGNSEIFLDNPETERGIPHSPTISSFIDAFDDGLPVQPFEFELELEHGD